MIYVMMIYLDDDIVGGILPTQNPFFLILKINLIIIINNDYNDDIVGG